MRIIAIPFISALCIAETLVIGVDSFCSDYKDLSPCSMAVLSATQGMLLQGGEPNPRLVSEVEARPGSWIFALAPDATFSNGTRVGLGDVFTSLKNCGVRVTARYFEADSGLVEVNDEEEKIKNCPIIPRDYVMDRFYSGTHPIGAGVYYVGKIRPGKDIELRGKIDGRNKQIYLVFEPNSESGISRVRSGEFAAYYSKGEILRKEDPTLRFFECQNYRGVRRSSFIGYCFESMSIDKFRYAEGGE
jgi:hypothetical protein